MTTFAEQFEKKFKANQAGQSSFAQRFETEGAGARILEDYRRRQEELKRSRPIETSRQQLDQSLSQYEESTGGWKGWLNKFLGRGTSKPVLVGETPEYTQARQQSEEGVKAGPVKRTVDFFTSGARESAFDVVYQRKLDKENLQRMDDNNRKIIDYTNKINQASGNTKARLEKLRQIYVDQNSQIAQDVGGELKNKTNAQLFGQSVETALDLTPFLGFQSILTNLGIRGVAKVTGKQAAKSLLGKKATSSLGKEAIKEGALFGGLMGASTGMQEENATVGSVAKSTGIGTAFGAGLGAIGAGLSKGFSKLASRKLTKNATEAIEKELGKLDADETKIIKESIEEGLSKDEIISDIKKSREIDVESRKELGIEDAFEEPKKPVEPTAAEYVESRKTKFREQNIPSHTRNEGKVYVPEYTRGAKNTEIDIKGGKQLQEDAMMKEVASEKALDDVTAAVEKGDVTMDEWASYNKLYEKIQKKPLTDAELLEARQILKKTGKMQSDIEAAKFSEKERIMKMVKEADKAREELRPLVEKEVGSREKEPFSSKSFYDGAKYREAQRVTDTKPDHLIQEVKKAKAEGKSFEEFLKSQGTPVYHGTNQDFDVFDVKMGGRMTKMGSAKDGIYFTSNADEAGAYSRLADKKMVANEDVFNAKYESMMKDVENLQKKQLWDKANALEQRAEKFYFDGIRDNQVKNARVVEAYLNINNPKVVNVEGSITSGRVQEIIADAKSKGHDSVILKNISDNPEGTRAFRSDHTIVFEPKNIKTKSQLEDIWNKANKVKYRTDAEVEFKKKFKELNRATLTDNQYKEIQKLNQKIFGDDDVRIVGQIGSNRRALGKYENNVIEILDGKADAKDTFIHEAVHKYLDAFSTKEEYIAVLEKAREIYGVKGSWSEVEEVLAESFIKYFKDKTKTPKSVAEFFEMMAERIKSYLKNKDEVQKLYDDILGGKAKKEASESLVQKKKKLSSLKRDRRQIIKDYLESEEGSMIVMEQQARGEIDNSYNEKVYSGIKNNPIYKKEKTVKDSMGEGYLLSKNGRYVVADAEQTAKLVDKGWKREMEIDSLANEEGFERGEDYLNSILEKAEEGKLLSSPERIAKQKLLQDDEAFSILEDEISRLNKETLPERKALADFKENLSEPKEIVGEGESKLAKRINENLPEGYEIDEFYDKENIINELNKASRDIKTDKTKAIRDAFDRNTKTSQRVVKLMELAQIAKNNGDYQTVNAILSRMRQEGTETAQALNMFKAYGLSNPETEFMKRVVEARMSRFKVSMENIKKATVREVQDKLKKVASGIKEKTRKAYKIEDAQQILNKIMCK